MREFKGCLENLHYSPWNFTSFKILRKQLYFLQADNIFQERTGPYPTCADNEINIQINIQDHDSQDFLVTHGYVR